MKVILFGATGMIGQAALRQCLLDDDVTDVLSVARTRSPVQHAKLSHLEHADFFDFTSIAPQLTGYDTCLWCLGASSTGMSEEQYARITVDMTIAAANVLKVQNPAMTFVFISGVGADATERGPVMWARVKGRAENQLQKVGFRGVYVFRPGFIQPKDGEVSRATLTRMSYIVFRPMLPVLKALFRKHFTDTQQLGRAMLHVAKHGYPQPVLENHEFDAIKCQ